ncbi:transposase domain-containing protein [Uliginosibacterium sp. 31-12]|uniref:transposase domain-containing protein n=1 Tax=Uliginosibacterium sp. 31-12 TaxID=3062781 RepID=UPI0034C5BB3F
MAQPLQEYLSDPHDVEPPEQRSGPQHWVEQALQMSNMATMRNRRLPTKQAIWRMLGVAAQGALNCECGGGAGARLAWTER